MLQRADSWPHPSLTFHTLEKVISFQPFVRIMVQSLTGEQVNI